MALGKIRCVVVRIPEDGHPVPPRAAWREALPWADPYILGLIRKLQREVRMERAGLAMAAKERIADLENSEDDELLPEHESPSPPPLTARRPR